MYCPSQIQRLREVISLRGIKAKNRAPELTDIKIKRADAEKVFAERTIPLEQTKTQPAFPGFDKLPADAQGALVSLVYNRGTSMIDKPGEDRRKEMRAICDAAAIGDLKELANQLRSMKHLWAGKGFDTTAKKCPPYL